MKPFAPRVLPWSRRLEDATPGLRALGYDPEGSRDELLFLLSHSETWDQEREVWLPTGRMNLLGGNAKMAKSLKEIGYLTDGLSLSPDLESGISTCPGSGACAAVCLAKTGKYVGAKHQRVRIKKTLLLNLFPEQFVRRLVRNLMTLEERADGLGVRAAARLNVLSDVAWERVPEIAALAEEKRIAFYDYTKVAWRARQPRPDGYHLTYSLSERRGSLRRALGWMDRGSNAAVVIGPALPPGVLEELAELNAQLRRVLLLGGSTRSPAYRRLHKRRRVLVRPGRHGAAAEERAQRLVHRGSLWGRKVVDGDRHDARFDDPPGRWVILYAKGQSAYDTTGFVVRIRADGVPVDRTIEDRMASEVPSSVTAESAAAFRQLLSPAARMALDPAAPPEIIVPGPESRLRRKKRGRPAARSVCFVAPVPWGVSPRGQRLPGGLV